jgi:hypothetical protein
LKKLILEEQKVNSEYERLEIVVGGVDREGLA